MSAFGHNRTVPTVRSGGCRTPWRQLSEGYLLRTGVQGNVRIRGCRFCRQVSTHENTANYPLCQHTCGFRRNEGFRIRATGSDVRAQYCRSITKLDGHTVDTSKGMGEEDTQEEQINAFRDRIRPMIAELESIAGHLPPNSLLKFDKNASGANDMPIASSIDSISCAPMLLSKRPVIRPYRRISTNC